MCYCHCMITRQLVAIALAAIMGLALFSNSGETWADSAETLSKKVPKNCTFKGTKLWGKVKVVKSFPDYKVRVVKSFADVHVKKVTSFPDSCGKWKFVDSFPDFKIQFVDSFPDFEIKYVNSFPGVP